MKELSIEEKAKRYNEALEKARQLYVAYPTTKSFISDLQDLFPELKENEDERILEKLISYFSAVKGFSTLECNYGITNEEAANWLKSLKNKVQPTQVWSVEDKLMLMSCIEIMQTVDSTEEQQNWLKSLRPQNHWKPSEEQIKALYDAVFENWETMDIDSLESLYNDLKKL
jgi:hypothetical protein